MIGCDKRITVRIPQWMYDRIQSTDETTGNFSKKLKVLIAKSVGREHEPPFDERKKSPG